MSIALFLSNTIHVHLGSSLDEGALLTALENHGIIDQVMNTLDLSGISQGSEVIETKVGMAEPRVSVKTHHDKNTEDSSELVLLYLDTEGWLSHKNVNNLVSMSVVVRALLLPSSCVFLPNCCNNKNYGTVQVDCAVFVAYNVLCKGRCIKSYCYCFN